MFLNSFFKSAFAIYIFSSFHQCSGQRDRRQSLALCGGDQIVYSTPLYITSMDCLQGSRQKQKGGHSSLAGVEERWPLLDHTVVLGEPCPRWHHPCCSSTSTGHCSLGLTPTPRHSKSLQTKKSLISRPHGNLGFAWELGGQVGFCLCWFCR